MTRELATKIATKHISKMNPSNWNGIGRKPRSFSTLVATYDIDSKYDELDISFEKEENPDTGKIEWTHCCELRSKSDGSMSAILHGYGIDSINNLVDTILDIVCSELGNEYD